VQDWKTKEILMVAFTDEAGFSETLRTGLAVYYSTSRNERWKKGEKSGNVQVVHDILIDCDGDAVVYVVEQRGDGACHTKALSCFFRRVMGAGFVAPAPKFNEAKDRLEVRDVEVYEQLCW
jgi:phosphoribosyl-AMP cyclohydrolase